jgi:hypothetical protein
VRSDGKVIYANSSLYAINPDGTQAWVQFGFGSAPWSAPTIDQDGNIYLIEDWELRKHSPTGQVLWTSEFIYEGNRLEQAYNAPIIDSAGRLYFGLGTGKRYALESAKGLVAYDSNGTKLYNLLLPETPSTSSPAMGADGTIYIGCLDGKLYAIGGNWMESGPSSLNVATGVTVSGGLPEVLLADDQYLQLRPGIVFTSSQKPIVVEFAGTLPTQLPLALQFVIESRGTSASITQYIEAWNYNSSAWVQVGQGSTPTIDGRTTVQISNPAQFVDPNRNVKVRVSYKADGPVFTYPWTIRIDQVLWRAR